MSRETRRPHDHRRPGRARAQPQEHLGRDPARQPRRRHRPLGLRQVEPGVRHHLRRGPAALHGVALELRQAVRRAGRQARRRLRLRPVARHLHRAEDARQQPAVDRRHDDRHRELPEPAVRDHRPGALSAHAARPTPSRTSSQILEAILSLPEGTEVELRAPVFKVYGEDLDFVFTEVRKKGCRRLIVDGKPVDLSEKTDARRCGRPAHGRRRRPLRRRPQAREGHQGRHRRDAARGRRAAAGARSAKGASKAEAERFYKGAVQPDASLRLRRHRPRVLRLQQPGERLPHVRRPRRRQADASGAARSPIRSAASSAAASCARRSSTTPTPGTDG